MTKTHRELYPAQYDHPLVDRQTVWQGKAVTILRVVNSRFGLLAVIDPDTAFAISVNDARKGLITGENDEV